VGITSEEIKDCGTRANMFIRNWFEATKKIGVPALK
jgi:hypothetical protein